MTAELFEKLNRIGDDAPILTENYMTLEETAKYFGLLDEAYYGRKPIIPIQRAMDPIWMKVHRDPSFRVQGSKEAFELERAVKKVFGFNRVSIYWRFIDTQTRAPVYINYRTGEIDPLHTGHILGGYEKYFWPVQVINIGTHGYLTGGHLINPVKGNKPGTNDNGFYDSNHERAAVICIDQYEIDQFGLTSEEMVAVLLHEIGHIFDNTLWRVIDPWFTFADNFIKWLIETSPVVIDELLQFLFNQGIGFSYRVLAEFIPKEIVELLFQWDDILMNIIPPIGNFARMFNNNFRKVSNFFRAFLYPIQQISRLPKIYMFIPLIKLFSLPTKKAETFADSFATQYGYGAELGTGLEKMSKYTKSPGDDIEKNFPVIVPFCDIANLTYELVIMMDGHENEQQRFKRTLATLDYDLSKANLTQEDRAEILKERERILDTYNKFLSLDENKKRFFTTMFRRLMERWYNGRTYLFTKALFPDQTYAN